MAVEAQRDNRIVALVALVVVLLLGIAALVTYAAVEYSDDDVKTERTAVAPAMTRQAPRDSRT